MSRVDWSSFFFFNDTATTEIYTLSLHDALPICDRLGRSDEDPPAHRHLVEARGLLGVVRPRVTRSFGHQIEPGPVLGEHAGEYGLWAVERNLDSQAISAADADGGRETLLITGSLSN